MDPSPSYPSTFAPGVTYHLPMDGGSAARRLGGSAMGFSRREPGWSRVERGTHLREGRSVPAPLGDAVIAAAKESAACAFENIVRAQDAFDDRRRREHHRAA